MKSDDIDRIIEGMTTNKNSLRKAADMALGALEDIFGKEKKDVGAINALRQALAQPVDAVNMSQECVDETAKGGHEWVGLTPIEFNSIKDTATTIGYAITKTEAMLKDKNT